MKKQKYSHFFDLSLLASIVMMSPSHGVEVFTVVEDVSIPGSYLEWSGPETQGRENLVFPWQVTSMVDLDTTASTIRIYGSVPAQTVSLSGGFEITDITGYTVPMFPDGPMPIYATGTVSYTADLNLDFFSFDTGTENYEWNGSSYEFGGSMEEIPSGTLDIAITLETGGEIFNDSILVPIWLNFGNGMRLIDTGDYPSSLSFSPTIEPQFYQGIGYAFGEFAPSNGLSSEFTIVTPEPSSFVMGLVGLITICIRRRRSP